ncbi:MULTISPECIES: signal peptidase I [Anaerostipes]|uniref:signal peptidase I n=1 Tax=Anaerostipes TaxID=207244 RepID=UPI0009532404|nr:MULTISPECIES: signal peptidase I [Anaerostipes]MCI5622741.1 signal peptidase I [Anaerostipes sp.]MDY2726006.1 signal peptidase I [Anaerostipes faecalis]OLR60100.1 signal peptidase I [Anaerostipes sp. 494a]
MEEKKEQEKKNSWKKEALSWVLCIVVTIVLTQLITRFVIINANIPSGSMENTIMTNDKLIALRTSYWFNDPQRGDIIIFEYPDNEEEWYIKRVIALPGETVEVKDGKVYINSSKTPLEEPYIKEEPVDDFGPYKVPENGYFVMGDNRNCSNDARDWDTHYVSRDEVLGKAWFRYYPSLKWIK